MIVCRIYSFYKLFSPDFSSSVPSIHCLVFSNRCYKFTGRIYAFLRKRLSVWIHFGVEIGNGKCWCFFLDCCCISGAKIIKIVKHAQTQTIFFLPVAKIWHYWAVLIPATAKVKAWEGIFRRNIYSFKSWRFKPGIVKSSGQKLSFFDNSVFVCEQYSIFRSLM